MIVHSTTINIRSTWVRGRLELFTWSRTFFLLSQLLFQPSLHFFSSFLLSLYASTFVLSFFVLFLLPLLPFFYVRVSSVMMEGLCWKCQNRIIRCRLWETALNFGFKSSGKLLYLKPWNCWWITYFNLKSLENWSFITTDSGWSAKNAPGTKEAGIWQLGSMGCRL